MRRFRIIRALLIAGVILGYGGGAFSIAHHLKHHRGHCSSQSR